MNRLIICLLPLVLLSCFAIKAGEETVLVVSVKTDTPEVPTSTPAATTAPMPTSTPVPLSAVEDKFFETGGSYVFTAIVTFALALVIIAIGFILG